MCSVEIDELIEEYMNTVISHLIFGSSLISINLVSNAAIACAVTFLWADVSVFLSQESVWNSSLEFLKSLRRLKLASFINHLCVAFRSHVLTSNFKRFQVYRRFDWLPFPVTITTWFGGKKWFTICSEEFCIYSKKKLNFKSNKLVNTVQITKLSLFVANWAALIVDQRSSNAAFAERMTAIESHLKMLVRIVDLVADLAGGRKSCKKRDN